MCIHLQESLWRMIDEAKRFDDKTSQPHCEDPAKLAWMREVEARLKALEEAQKVKTE